MLPGEGGKDVFHGSSKLSNTMPPPPPPPKENFESCTVAYCCHKKAMGSAGAGAGTGEATGGGEAAWDLSGESTLRNVNEYLYSFKDANITCSGTGRR